MTESEDTDGNPTADGKVFIPGWGFDPLNPEECNFFWSPRGDLRTSTEEEHAKVIVPSPSIGILPARPTLAVLLFGSSVG